MARTLFEQALAVYEAHGNLKGQADTLARLGSLDAQEKHDHGRAERAARIYAEIGDDKGRLFALNIMSIAAKERGDLIQAGEHLREALDVARACGDVDGEAGTLIGLASHVMTTRRDVELSEKYVLAARDLIPRLVDPGMAITIHSMLGSLALSRGDVAAAERSNRHALDYHSEDWAGSSAAAHGAAADGLTIQGRTDKATREALEQVRLLERERRRLGNSRNQARAYRKNRPVYRRALDLAATSGDGEAALEVLESGRAQALTAVLGGDPQLIAHNAFDFDGELDQLLRRISTFEESPDVFRTGGNLTPEARSGWTAMMATALEEDHERLANLIGTELLRKAAPPETIADHRAMLPSRTHTLAYDIEWQGSRATVYAVWVPPLPAAPTVDRINLTAEQSRWVRTLADQDTATTLLNHPSHGWQTGLSSLVPQGLRNILTGSERHQDGIDLVIVPTGELWAIPFAALHVAETPLLDLATLSLSPSLGVAATASTRRIRPVRRALAVLDTRLRGTSAERATLKRHFRLREVPPLASDIVTALGPRNKFDLGVVSAHGDNVRGLAHSLRIGKEARLFAGVLLRCDVPLWWVMGACWSGRVNNEPGQEPVGLPTVALLRGARAVVAALHVVPDRATGQILATTYRGLAEGKPAPAALRAAQREYLANRGGPPLIHWAPLVSIGAPGAVGA
ncbi:hypothetical protein BU204_08715 [Actinophytocola xanthii]|uniref:CHAT domain-containing protein n=1 Tax=Actinophytocola xanthii TaxID=1912961 RepID=A0A1Q8CU95_9PSEU|nr:hypothetical protein BU204_08715 [Actinophytocola xanthii]